ncbi:UPF0652 protein [Hanseniaspora osmophila]|uniref:UPF0652 protein n=1 Tax=Hanseniaspora osmophila TaxID=56408 RepID=A0A1E5RNZ8_9ASCO|nr:UPF0652 protein [Hanseniaspora osmophila]
MSSKRTLKEILDSEYVEDADEDMVDEKHGEVDEDDDDDAAAAAAAQDVVDPNLCIECKDMQTEILCKDCEEQFCVVCFDMIHRGGKRKEHEYLKVNQLENNQSSNGQAVSPQGVSSAMMEPTSAARTETANVSDNATAQNNETLSSKTSIEDSALKFLQKNIQYIPIRLTHEERHLLRLLEAALEVSEYTDRVDILSYKSKTKRIVAQLKEICSILCGLTIASDLKIGKKLLEMKNFEDNAAWFQDVFEIGRRYKIMNPDKMKSTYGKLCYMVMDSRLSEIEEYMGFHLFKPIKNVHEYVESKDSNALKMFEDKMILYATMQISPVGKSRSTIDKLIRQKEKAIEMIASKYSSNNKLSKDDIRQLLYSIGDFNAYTNINRKPILRMLERLQLFKEPEIEARYSLGIQYGKGGARLTHNHDRQWHYVQQSLTLWSVIQRDMIKLWYIADQDLFNGSSYRLTSTGQGLNRVKPCPQLYKTMHTVLHECRNKCDTWVGSSVVHLGDDAVPNALFFLDKYTQVPSILIPFDQVLMKINDLVANDQMMLTYINDIYGSVDDLKLIILSEFFTHAFDGSGADNFYMSGSCIDGRLTSAWNHTNQISKKNYYNIFLMTGFTSFNGEGF